MRELVEEQNRRISELEEAVRTGRELEAAPDPTPAAPVEPSLGPPPAAPDVSGKVLPAEQASETVSEPEEATEPETHEPGAWRRILAWFGFGVLGLDHPVEELRNDPRGCVMRRCARTALRRPS